MKSNTIRPLLAACALGASLLALATSAQAEPAALDQSEPGRELGESEEEEAETAADTKSGGWQFDPRLRLTARGITARSTAPGEDEVIDGNAVAVLIAPALVLTNDDVKVTLRNTTTRLEFEDANRTDRWQNAARLTARFDLSDALSVTAFGERADNMLAAEFTSTDEWEFGGELEYRLNRANRVQLGGSWRERSYDDTAGSTGSGMRVDGEYRYRFSANHYAYLRARYDEINSDTDRRNLDRWRVEASYQRPIARDLRVRSELSYQQLNFSGRVLDTGGVREDEVFWPELTLIWSPGPWRIAAEARYIFRESTDPQFDRSGYRFELEARHEF